MENGNLSSMVLFSIRHLKFQLKLKLKWISPGNALNPVMDYINCVDVKQVEMSSNVAS